MKNAYKVLTYSHLSPRQSHPPESGVVFSDACKSLICWRREGDSPITHNNPLKIKDYLRITRLTVTPPCNTSSGRILN